jgi:hypothetical protein
MLGGNGPLEHAPQRVNEMPGCKGFAPFNSELDRARDYL